MKRIAVALSVLTVLVLAGPAGAELCEKCKGKMYIANVGQCVECGGFTGSGAHKLCPKCSARLGQCEHCRAPLKGAKPAPVKPEPKPEKINWKNSGTYTSGKWKYDYTIIISHPHKRGGMEYIGSLFYDGKPIAGAKMWDRIKTPWGLMQYLGRKKRQLNQGWMSARNSKGRLLPSPEKGKSASTYLRALELDASSNGKTVSAIVGQQIIIRLKGAPMPGHMWNPAKFKGDAIEQVGQMKFVPDARPRPVFVPGPRHQQPGPVPGARPQPMAGGLVAHTVGGPGKYVFTFRAVKAGKAEVTIKGRVHRQRRPVRTFALTVNVKADPTAERIRKLKANLDKFAMTICYRGQGPRGGRPPRWCRHITLSVPPALVPRTPSWQVRQISTEQAGKIIDRLAKTGFLARAAPRAAPVRKMGDRYALAVYMRKSGPRNPMLMDIIEDIGWGPQLLKRLEGLGLKEVLDGDAAKAVDFLLEPMAERFREKKEGPAPLEQDESSNGKTVSAVVGQEIIIRLKGNATTGYSWVAGKIEGDAIKQVGKVKYVSDQPPMPAGGRGRGLMMHRVGGGGKYVFTFTAKKAGTAKLTLEYKRGWEKGKPPAKTFTLTVNIKADPTAGRVKKLKANIDSFKFALDYHNPQGKPLYRGFVLSVPRVKVEAVMGFDHVTISRKQAEKIIDYLATNGVLAASGLVTDRVSLPLGPAYDATMRRNRKGMTLCKNPGWGPGMLKRLDGMLKQLDGLRKVLDGDAAKAVDKLLKQLEPQRKKWQKPAAKPDPTAKRGKKLKPIIIIYIHVALPRSEE